MSNKSESKCQKVFSEESLINHVKSNPSKIFVSIHENVYEVSSFLNEHPGGKEVIKEHIIKSEFRDATEAFEESGHSMDARDKMKEYRIGSIQYNKEITRTAENENNENPSNLNYMPIIAMAVAVIAFGFIRE
jgi:cytochrome b involved in lipid metabolism